MLVIQVLFVVVWIVVPNKSCVVLDAVCINMILTCGQDDVSLSLFGKLHAIFAPENCGLWDA